VTLLILRRSTVVVDIDLIIFLAASSWTYLIVEGTRENIEILIERTRDHQTALAVTLLSLLWNWEVT
jgi:hypothetical protein